jgi:hypothetical protein
MAYVSGTGAPVAFTEAIPEALVNTGVPTAAPFRRPGTPNVTATPGTTFPSTSLTVTASGTANSVLTFAH